MAQREAAWTEDPDMKTPGAENEPIQPEEDELQHLNT